MLGGAPAGWRWRKASISWTFPKHRLPAGSSMGAPSGMGLQNVTRRGVPQYFLYGEASQDVDERFLHVESIAERSRLHDWTIRPHAHRDLHHLLLVQRGGGVYSAEGSRHEFAPVCADQRAAVVRAWVRFQAAHRRLDRHRVRRAAATNRSRTSGAWSGARRAERHAAFRRGGRADEQPVRIARGRVSRSPARPAHRGGVVADGDPRRSVASQARARAGRVHARAHPIRS